MLRFYEISLFIIAFSAMLALLNEADVFGGVQVEPPIDLDTLEPREDIGNVTRVPSIAAGYTDYIDSISSIVAVALAPLRMLWNMGPIGLTNMFIALGFPEGISLYIGTPLGIVNWVGIIQLIRGWGFRGGV